MNFSENIKIALQSVRANILRSILTLLIIAFGIMALVGILTAIDNAIYSLSDNFSRLGANSFSIFPNRDNVRGNQRGKKAKAADVISFKQAMAFKERFDFPAKVSISMWCTGNAVVKYGDKKTNPTVLLDAVDENHLYVKGYEVEFGRNFSKTEVEQGGNKAIIGKEVIETLFNGKPEQALNKVIAVGNVKYKVIGILKSRGSSMNQSDDRRVLIPLMNGKRYYGSANKNYRIEVAVTNATEMDNATAAATGLFRNIRKLKATQENDFRIFQSDSLVSIIKENTTNLRLGAVVIGLMTLLGAAIGLMNIMLVSVTERTREVGICKAIGATKQNILIQFLTEAVVICQMGGLVGILFGVLIGYAVANAMEGSFHVPWNWIGLAIFVCMVVGVVSGLYPALKAARLDPIESLRYE
ncbi:MAG: FtsX-like permease family protein [Bacteroidetes bacterium]|nr:MAG: FtsX-like permease family protein [Bacteroidota bacterium]